MVIINFVNEDYDEIKRIEAKGTLFEVFTMLDKTPSFSLGKDLLHHQKIETYSIDFQNDEIFVQVIEP